MAKTSAELTKERFGNILTPEELDNLSKSIKEFGLFGNVYQVTSGTIDLVAKGNDFDKSFAYMVTVVSVSNILSGVISAFLFSTAGETVVIIGGYIIGDLVDIVIEDTKVHDALQRLFDVNKNKMVGEKKFTTNVVINTDNTNKY